MATPNKVKISLVDINGNDGSTNFHVVDTTVTIAAVAALIGAYKAGSNCKITQVNLTLVEAESGDAVNATYESVTDKAVMVFKSSDTGQVTRFTVGAPKEAMFEENQDIVDPSAPLTAAIISAYISVASTTGNAQSLEFVKGWRDKT